VRGGAQRTKKSRRAALPCESEARPPVKIANPPGRRASSPTPREINAARDRKALEPLSTGTALMMGWAAAAAGSL
jgi:hypothetical protein